MTELMARVRELKSQLGKYLHQVKAGRTIVITEHGKAVAHPAPARQAVDEKSGRWGRMERQEAETHQDHSLGEGRLFGGQPHHRGAAMILYLDSSALVKRCLIEARSAEVKRVKVEAEQTGTAMLTRAEVSAAIVKAVRMNWVARNETLKSLAAFQLQWASLFRLHIREATVEPADTLAWAHGLRGYDTMDLACAALWQQAVSGLITLATFDQQQREVAQTLGLAVWPDALLPTSFEPLGLLQSPVP